MLHEFTSKLALEHHLSTELKKLNEHDEYNIFLHQIFPLHDDESDIARWVLKEGLYCNHPSLNYPLMHMGTSKNITPEIIMNYSYNQKPDTHTLVFAIPTFIIVDGIRQEYSTPTDKNYYGKIEPNYLLDHIKDDKLFAEYTLGYVHVDTTSDQKIFEFTTNEQHFSKLDANSKHAFDAKITEKVKLHFAKINTETKEKR